jgi:serine phosphatase RsbU (regulator of sigma subunit)
VLEECTSVLTTDAASDPRFQNQQSIVLQSVHSAMAVPLFDNERVLGLIYVDSHDAGVAFGEEQLELLTLLANMAAVKITNARLLQTEQAHARMAHELATATQIQRGLLPVAPPEVPGYRFDAFLESCYEVGGDLYDFYHAGDGRLLFAVGDVTGKGMGAALLMSSFLSSLRVLYDACPDLAELARRLNVITYRSTDAVRYVTGVIVRLDPASGTLEVVNAGHPAPTLVLDGELRKLESGGVPFGILPDSDYAVETVCLRPGELLAVCSDGIPEARRGEEFFDDERLEALLRDARGTEDLAALRSHIVSQVTAFVGDQPRGDDITLLLLRRDR